MIGEREYYTETELVQLANNCNSFEELTSVAVALKWLWALGECIDLKFFDALSHKRIRQLA